MAAFEAFRPLNTLSLFAMIGLGLMIATELLSGLVGLLQVISPQNTVDFEGEMSLWLLLQGIVALIRFPTFIFTVVFFLIWLHRAHSNLLPLGGQNLEFSPGWAVGWWFIPFANLVKPYQVVREIWSESDPDVGDGSPTFLSSTIRTAPTYMAVWWGMWIAMNIANNVTERTYDPDTMENIELSGAFFAISAIISVIAALLAIMVIRDITRRQAERHVNYSRRFNTNTGPPPPPTF